MKHKMLCDDDVPEKCWERCTQSNEGSKGSCNSFIADGADRVDVLMNNRSNNRSIGVSVTSKPRFRSYCCNRFSYIFPQKQNYSLLVFMAVYLCMPLICIGTTSNLNETEIALNNSLVATNFTQNSDVSNEITTNLEENQNSEDSENFIGSSLSETLEDSIRNAVKNEIEQESNVGSGLINALNVMPVTESIVLVEYPQATKANVEKKIIPSIAPEEVAEAKLESSCDESSLNCKRVTGEVVTSTTLKPEIEVVTVAASPIAVDTKMPIIHLEDTSTMVPIYTTILPVANEHKEEEFDVVEDNEREARNLESIAIETAEQPAIKTEINTLKAPLEHKPSKDVLKSIILTEDSVDTVKGETAESVILNYKAYNVSSTLTPEQSVITLTNSSGELISNNNDLEDKTLGTDLPSTNFNETKSSNNEVKIVHTSSNNAVAETSNELSDLSRSVIEEQELKETKEKVDKVVELESNQNRIAEEHLKESSTTPILQHFEPIYTEFSNDLQINPLEEKQTSDVIIPVVADHNDLYTKEMTTTIASPIAVESQPNVDISNEKAIENETLSITFKESLTATEQSISLEDSKDKTLLNMEDIDVVSMPVEHTTLLPEIVNEHNVIKKQGVEEFIDDELFLISSTTAMPVEEIEPIVLAARDREELVTDIAPTVSPTETELIATTMKSIETTGQNTNDITEMSVAFAGKGDDDAVSTAKGSRSVNLIHTEPTEHHKASKNVEVYAAGQTFNENLAEEMPNGIGKALPTHRRSEELSNHSTIIITTSSCVAILFIVISVTIFMVSFQRQHGTLDIEMQEQRCGKDNQDDEAETCIKLLDVELPNTSLAFQTETEAEIEECL